MPEPAYRVRPIPTEQADAYRAGALDANGQPPERAVSDGAGAPCRCCLRDIPAGRPMVILAHRPFPEPQPYAEIGPIFLCADPCVAWSGAGLPILFADWPRLLIRGYADDDRIVYGTGQVVATADLDAAMAALFANPRVRYVHWRSASNNCFQARADRPEAV